MNTFFHIAIGFCLYPIIGHTFNYFYYGYKLKHSNKQIETFIVDRKKFEEFLKHLDDKDDDDNNLAM